MSQVIHLAAEISSGQAHAVVADLDWPNATQLKPIEMPAELYWLPFDRKNRLSLLDSEKHPQLACLELPPKTDFSNVNEGPPAKDSGRVLSTEPVFHWLWHVSLHCLLVPVHSDTDLIPDQDRTWSQFQYCCKTQLWI